MSDWKENAIQAYKEKQQRHNTNMRTAFGKALWRIAGIADIPQSDRYTRDDVTFQFYWGRKGTDTALHLIRKCPGCDNEIWSDTIYDQADLGRELVEFYKQDKECIHKPKVVIPPNFRSVGL